MYIYKFRQVYWTWCGVRDRWLKLRWDAAYHVRHVVYTCAA